MSVRLFDYIFWNRYATRVAPAEFYFDIYCEFRSLTLDLDQDGDAILEVIPKMESRSLMLAGLPPLTEAELEVAKDAVRTWSAKGYALLLPSSPLWPRTKLRGLTDPPRGLFVLGAAQLLETPLLAVVGSREVSRPSLEWLETELGEFLRREVDVNLLSGGARGVDQCAHRTALRKGRPTVVFLPSGFDQIYPRELERWREDILRSGGCFVSEYAPGATMRKPYFGERNRLISAFSDGVLIVEARRRSGTLLTAKAAADQSRAVFVVPGAPYDSQFAGSLDLINEGATMVRDAQELSVFFHVEIRNSYHALKSSSTDRGVISVDH
ncbi:MAG: DNA-protecting protein DprA [Bdellovibrionaceae bacterium]|nr:DNA-protecting protein DprA [Pseudobdellovibrionaceae bacterium]